MATRSRRFRCRRTSLRSYWHISRNARSNANPNWPRTANRAGDTRARRRRPRLADKFQRPFRPRWDTEAAEASRVWLADFPFASPRGEVAGGLAFQECQRDTKGLIGLRES